MPVRVRQENLGLEDASAVGSTDIVRTRMQDQADPRVRQKKPRRTKNRTGEGCEEPTEIEPVKRYGRIYEGFWEEFRTSLPATKIMAAYLFSNRHINLLGVYRLPIEYICRDLNMPADEVNRILSELEESHYIRRHDEWIGVRTYIKHNLFGGGLVEKSICARLPILPNPPCVWAAIGLKTYYRGAGEALRKCVDSILKSGDSTLIGASGVPSNWDLNSGSDGGSRGDSKLDALPYDEREGLESLLAHHNRYGHRCQARASLTPYRSARKRYTQRQLLDAVDCIHADKWMTEHGFSADLRWMLEHVDRFVRPSNSNVSVVDAIMEAITIHD